MAAARVYASDTFGATTRVRRPPPAPSWSFLVRSIPLISNMSSIALWRNPSASRSPRAKGHRRRFEETALAHDYLIRHLHSRGRVQ
jgi:hypothetical protein